MLSVLLYLFLLVATILYFVLFCLVFILTAPFDDRRSIVHELSALWTRFYFRVIPGWKVEVQGLEKIEKGVPYVVIVNHNSMLDIPLMYVLPIEFKWVAKKEVYKWPLFGWVMHMHGDIGIERGTAKAVKKMIREGGRWLQRGVSLIIFPEGSRSKDGEIHKFKEGAFMMARQAGVGILPCVAEGTSRFTKGWQIRTEVKFTVRVLDPVPPGVVAESESSELSKSLREKMIVELEQIRKSKNI